MGKRFGGNVLSVGMNGILESQIEHMGMDVLNVEKVRELNIYRNKICLV